MSNILISAMMYYFVYYKMVLLVDAVTHPTLQLLLSADFVEQGVSKEDIVLGFHPPSVRKFTKYAVS
jgi:XisI protein